MKIDLYFSELGAAERMRLHEEAQREADLDALEAEFFRLKRLPREKPEELDLGLAVNAAARSVRETGALDWRFVVAELIGQSDHEATCAAIERLACAKAAPGDAAAKTGGKD